MIVLTLFCLLGCALLLLLTSKFNKFTSSLIFILCLIGFISSIQTNLVLLNLVWIILSISFLRLYFNRYGAKRLKRIELRTFIYTISLFSLAWLFVQLDRPIQEILLSSLILFICIRSLVLVSIRSFTTTLTDVRHEVAKQSPTVTLAIPARNETHALTDALRSAVASQYPKLEILVLDDCSQDSTPDIIKSFANDGVRFIQGVSPNNRWVGKNNAYQALLEEASGDLVIFCGVDIRFSAGTVTAIVEKLQQPSTKLLTIMPHRRSFDLLAELTQPLRYFWQLSFSTWPVSTSCWAVDRKWLLSEGGFKKFRHAIKPEQKIAAIAKNQGAYVFSKSLPMAGPAVTTRKRPSSILQTAVRTLYPSTQRELAFMAAKTFAIGLFTTSLLLGWEFFADNLAKYLSFSGLIIFTISFAVYQMTMLGIYGGVGGLIWPLIAFNEIIYSLISFWSYEFGKVEWKGRNVCIPVLNPMNSQRVRVNPKKAQPT